jgi:hypothetical protein
MSMEMSFFTSCPLTGGISVPLQTMCTSNSSLFSRVFARVHRFEVAFRLVFVRVWLKKDISMLMHQVFKRDKMLPFNKEYPNG